MGRAGPQRPRRGALACHTSRSLASFAGAAPPLSIAAKPGEASIDVPHNTFKAGLLAKRRQIGGWVSTVSPTVTEVFAHSGLDWVLVDMEHGAVDTPQLVEHLRAANGGAPVMVRVPWNEPVLVKRILDIGTQSILFPFVQNAAEAKAAVAATRYPPHGIRGVATASRATLYGQRAGYQRQAAAQIAVVVQIESAVAVDNVTEIASVEGVDGVFIGPNDLAASMGLLGEPNHPKVREVMLDCAKKIHAAGKSTGTLNYPATGVPSPFQDGFDFLGVAFDTGGLARMVRDLLAEFGRLREIP